MIKDSIHFYEKLVDSFPHSPTQIQNELLKKLSKFIFSKNVNELFLLKGYAGTGKTTSVSTVVNNLWRTGKKAVLLAPTGRAAKVIANYSKREAFTIHKKIYYPKKASNGSINFTLQTNKYTDTIFFIDEVSMIPEATSNTKLFDNISLLDDLLLYIYSGKNCKAVFIGDTAQLPPIKLNISPALNADKLTLNYSKDVLEIELDEVTRQLENSGILINATQIRVNISNHDFNFNFNLNYPDVIKLTDSYEIQDSLTDSYSDDGIEDTALIVRSNKRANLYNKQIRNKIRDLDNQISAGDFIMVVKNNYYWLKDSTTVGFIANGDICEILEIFNIKELYGFTFAEVKIRMIDYATQRPFKTVLLLDTLNSESASLSYTESNKLYEEVSKDFKHEKSKYKKLLSIKNNKYFNALQVKFSYAMTCHKAQGGQWKKVFIEQPYLPNGANEEYLRWLYTAVTRATDKLYLIGFSEDYFE